MEGAAAVAVGTVGAAAAAEREGAGGGVRGCDRGATPAREGLRAMEIGPALAAGPRAWAIGAPGAEEGTPCASAGA